MVEVGSMPAETRTDWVHLRTCQVDGLTRCCDMSPNQHARRHEEVTKHPVIVSAEPTDNWAYCYNHDEYKQGPEYNAHPRGA